VMADCDIYRDTSLKRNTGSKYSTT